MAIFSRAELLAARQRTVTQPWAGAVLAALRERAVAWLAHPEPIPEHAGGWMHDYVCPEHWHALIFAPGAPGEQRCPQGELVSGARPEAAWRVLQHRRCAAMARDLALVAALSGDEACARGAEAVLLSYARRYQVYAGHADAPAWMLKGRAFNQALTEALWTVPLAQAFDLLRPWLAPQQRRLIIAQLLRPISVTLARAHEQLVQREGKLQSNYNAWLLAGLGSLAFALDDHALAEWVIDGPAGWRAHLAAAIHPDGFEYEGSPYYHVFVALAYTLLAEAARPHGYDLYAAQGPDGQSITSTWRAAAALAWPDGSLPLANDGAYWSGGPLDAELCELFELALARSGEPEFAWLLQRAYTRRGVERDQWSALLAGQQEIAGASAPARPAICLPAAGMALLRGRCASQAAFVPFGPYGGAHGHFDRLALQVWPWSPDPGTPPYGVEPRTSWYQQTAAHNALVVDGSSQAPGAGELLRWAPASDGAAIELASTAVYSDVRLTRQVKLQGARLEDRHAASAGSERRFDYLLHFDELLAYDATLEPARGTLAAAGPYQFATLLAHCERQDRVSITTTAGGRRYQLALAADQPFQLLLAEVPGPAWQPTRRRRLLIARTAGRGAGFTLVSEEAGHG